MVIKLVQKELELEEKGNYRNVGIGERMPSKIVQLMS